MLPFPFHFLNNNQAMNLRPRHYSWHDFYDHVIDLTEYSFSWKSIFRRCRSTPGLISRGMNLVRAVSTEGFGRLRHHREVRRLLDKDRQFLAFFEQETEQLPALYLDLVRKDLGLLWEWLPEGALHHDPNAYSNWERSKQASGILR